MAKPIIEIAEYFEKTENCKIVICQGASADLRNSILHSKIGDLFLPGSSFYVKEDEKGDIFLDELHYSSNNAAIFVQKNNPQKITSDLNNFTNKNYSIVIGNPESCSIGRIAKLIFDGQNIYNSVIGGNVRFASDSKDISRIMKNYNFDLGINWISTISLEDNTNSLDIIEFPDSMVQSVKLPAYILKYSRNIEIAQKFMKYLVSENGKSIFNKYGFK
jgi:molybdate transport system substrate-binding protein